MVQSMTGFAVQTRDLGGVSLHLELRSVVCTAREAAENLVAAALGNLGRDNVTVLVIDVHSVGDSHETLEVPTLAVDE